MSSGRTPTRTRSWPAIGSGSSSSYVNPPGGPEGLALDVGREEVDARRTDEVRDELVHRRTVHLFRGPDLLEHPPSITAIRSPIAIASVWSWVT